MTRNEQIVNDEHPKSDVITFQNIIDYLDSY